MLALIIGPGIGLLIGAAILIGHERATEQAWREIARERRALHETRRHLDELADGLTEEGARLHEWEARLSAATEHQRNEDGARPWTP